MKNGKMILGILLLLILVLATTIFKTNSNNISENKYIQKEIEIPKGSSLTKASQILKSEGIIKSSNSFKNFMIDEGYDNKLQPGTFDLNSDMTDKQIAEIITTVVKKETIKITIKEGLNNKEIANYLNEVLGIDKEIFLDLCNKPNEFDKNKFSFLKKFDDSMTLEGFLFPETYEVYKDASEKDIIIKLIGQFQKVYVENIENKELNSSLKDIVIMASLIEAEAKLDEERAIIASVFYNRIDKDQKLESCATVQYALGEHKERLLYEDLEIDSPYNTYKYNGLPIGAIGNPGLNSILASINPEETDYYFFTYNFDGTGTHTFSKTLKEHNIATEKARKNRGN
jgi:UPF0755 protein